jgi:hypothetical protein
VCVNIYVQYLNKHICVYIYIYSITNGAPSQEQKAVNFTLVVTRILKALSRVWPSGATHRSVARSENIYSVALEQTHVRVSGRVRVPPTCLYVFHGEGSDRLRLGENSLKNGVPCLPVSSLKCEW